MRKLWHDLLPFESETYFHAISQSLGVVAFMMRNALIPEAQREEVFDHILGKLHESYPHDSYSDDVLDELTPFGFWEAVHRHAFRHVFGSRLGWLARNIFLGIEYLARFPVDLHVASGFAALIPEEIEEGDDYLRNAHFYEPEDAWDLKQSYFSAHPEKLEELEKVGKENGIDISHFVKWMKDT